MYNEPFCTPKKPKLWSASNSPGPEVRILPQNWHPWYYRVRRNMLHLAVGTCPQTLCVLRLCIQLSFNRCLSASQGILPIITVCGKGVRMIPKVMSQWEHLHSNSFRLLMLKIIVTIIIPESFSLYSSICDNCSGLLVPFNHFVLTERIKIKKLSF